MWAFIFVLTLIIASLAFESSPILSAHFPFLYFEDYISFIH